VLYYQYLFEFTFIMVDELKKQREIKTQSKNVTKNHKNQLQIHREKPTRQTTLEKRRILRRNAFRKLRMKYGEILMSTNKVNCRWKSISSRRLIESRLKHAKFTNNQLKKQRSQDQETWNKLSNFCDSIHSKHHESKSKKDYFDYGCELGSWADVRSKKTPAVKQSGWAKVRMGYLKNQRQANRLADGTLTKIPTEQVIRNYESVIKVKFEFI